MLLKIAAHTSTQLNDEFWTLQTEMSKKDEFYHHKMQEFAVQAEEAPQFRSVTPHTPKPVAHPQAQDITRRRQVELERELNRP